MEFEPIFSETSRVGAPRLIAGPCSAESEEQVMQTASELSALGIDYYRAGLWKPRTKPGGFEGVGSKGLAWLRQVKAEYGIPVGTEVATPRHVELALKGGMDMLWIGARTVTNPFAMEALAQELAGTDIPILVKNPVNPDIELWVGGIERLYRSGVRKLGAIHRGFSSYKSSNYRNIPYWNIAIELRRRLPGLPIICDPSHIGGKQELIAPISKEAMELQMDGLIIETHCCPECALSDSQQQITPAQLHILIEQLDLKRNHTNDVTLRELRLQIDAIDQSLLELLARRMELSVAIGEHKQRQHITVLQPDRYDQLLAERQRWAEELGLTKEFAKGIMEQIHQESVNLQLQLLKNIAHNQPSKDIQ